LLLAVCVALLATGCSDDEKDEVLAPPPAEKVPDFSLLNVNPASPLANQQVSPRQLEGKISAWYFAHST